MIEKLRPLGDRALLKRVADQDKTEGGIIIPDAAKEKAQTAVVVAVGQGRRETNGTISPLAVKTGDIVFVGKYSGTEAGKDHIIVREDEILGILESK